MQLSAFLNLEFFQQKVYSVQLVVRIALCAPLHLLLSLKICVDELSDFDVTMVRISRVRKYRLKNRPHFA